MERLIRLSGQIIGKYELKEYLNRGGMAVLYLVQSTVTGKEYAMKIMIPSEETEEDFEREKAVFEILSREPACNEYVVCLKEAFVQTLGFHRPMTYYVMVLELMTSTLQSLFFDQSKVPPEPLLPEPFLLIQIMMRLLEGLVEIHTLGIVHNDIKLDNILYKYVPTGIPLRLGDEMGILLKYGDLGLSCTDRSHLPVRSKIRLCDFGRGTPLYFSPERAASAAQGKEEEITLEQAQKSDVWALGVTFRLLANNTLPFVQLTELRDRIDEGEETSVDLTNVFQLIASQPITPMVYEFEDPFLDTLIHTAITRMTLRDPEERSSAQEVLNYLQRSLYFEGYFEE